MTRSVPVGAVRPFGDRALLVGVTDAAAGRALAQVLRHELARGDTGHDHVELVCGQATVLVALAHDGTPLEAVRAAVERAVRTPAPHGGTAPPGGQEPGRLLTIPCAFDGPDLEEVSRQAGCTPDEVVRVLTARELTVGVVGFSPGFAYLEGLGHPLAGVPRRAAPRPVVPAGSVAIANGYAAVYPTPSPGGWHLVGRTGVALFSSERPPYAVLAPGDRVRFTAAGPGDPLEPRACVAPPWVPPPGTRPVLEVVAPGLRAVVQDAGRHAVAAAGVPAAGPADPVSFTLANLVLGNAPSAGALELTGGGTRLRALTPCHVAVVGGAPEVRIDGSAVPAGRVLPLAPGQVLVVGPPHRGCRTYLAVAGGVEGPALFGSRASDELTGLGPGPLGAGHRLVAGPWAAPLGDHVAPGAASELGPRDVPVALRVLPGPHAEHFAPDALSQLARVVFRVGRDSNRVGIRLHAEEGGSVARLAAPDVAAGALDSHGVVTGAVQLPPSGEPVVLLPDHATMGGYPVLAVVVRTDHGRLGQCAPGTAVRLVPVDAAEAAAAAGEARRVLEGAVRGRYPLAAG